MLHIFKRLKAANSQPDAVRQAFEQALDQRSKVDLEFDPAKTSLRGLAANVAAVGQDTVTLAVFGLGQPGSLAGEIFSGFFRIRDHKGRPGYFMFRSRVLRIAPSRSGVWEFVTSLPQRLDNSQRRRSLRLKPRLDWFEDVKLWRGHLEVTGGESEPVAVRADFLQTGLVRLEDVSAGGLGVYMSRDFHAARELVPARGEYFTAYFLFADEMRNQPRELWLAARAVRISQDPVDRSLYLGLEFERAGSRNGDRETVVWSGVRENVAQEISERVFAWHTVLFRERGA